VIAATAAKMVMQIAVTNQNRKSIRPRSSEACSGSQSTKIATAVTAAPTTTAMRISWTIAARRIRREPTETGGGAGG
jgi:hypothetical protein